MKKIALTILIGCAAAGCMPDSTLAERRATRARLYNEAWRLRKRVARAEALHGRLEAAVRIGAEIGGAAALARELKDSGFAIEKSASGTLRLRLEGRVTVAGRGEAPELDPVAASRLARMATLLGERLPGHELSIEARNFSQAVAAVRVLHDEAGIPGPRLRASVGRIRSGLVIEVRPTRAETLIEVQEVMTALSD